METFLRNAVGKWPEDCLGNQYDFNIKRQNEAYLKKKKRSLIYYCIILDICAVCTLGPPLI